MKNLTLFLALGIFISLQNLSAFGQQIDQDRMEKDLKVAETILEGLSQDQNQIMAMDRQYQNFNQLKGLKGYISTSNWQTQAVPGSQYLGGFGVIIRYDTDKGKLWTFPNVQPPSKERLAREMEFFNDPGSGAPEITGQHDSDSSVTKKEDDLQVKNMMGKFLLDYADLIGQLKPEDKIMVAENPQANLQFLQQNQGIEELGKETTGWTAVILKSDLTAYKSGNISREEAIERIQFTENQPAAEINTDARMLLNIIERLYAPDISSTYYLQRKSSVEFFTNFGVVYNFDFYSSIKLSEDNFDMPTLGLNGLTQIERDHKVKKLYWQFLTDIKLQLITYGKTVRSLHPEESLMFRIKLTPCKDCGIPDQLAISAKSKDLRDFDQGKISEKDMLNLLKVTEKTGES